MGGYLSKIGSVTQNEVSKGGGADNLNTHPLSTQDGFEFVPCAIEKLKKLFLVLNQILLV